VRHEPFGRSLGPHLVRRLAEGERLGLGEDVGEQQVVVPAERVERPAEADEVAGDERRPLGEELVMRCFE